MRILTVLTYYRPHTSGLTIYTERLAQALVQRGHQVTILTSQYMKTLPKRETLEGVSIVRSPIVARISKGVISRELGWLASELVQTHDIVHLHLPQFDAPGIALRGRLARRPTILTYHCDISLPPNPFNNLVNRVVNGMDDLAARFCDRIVTYTQDYADHSPYLSRFRDRLQIIPPPVVLPQASPGAIQEFSSQYQVRERRPVIGMAARLATEKGVEILLEAMPRLLDKYPHAQVLFAGQYQDVLGEEDYARKLMPIISRYEAQGHWKFLGVLDPASMAAFYPNLDVLVVPSLNSTEAFGLVQIEAMLNGVPCIASNLPGVRQPIMTTGMGIVTPIGDSTALGEALIEILDQPAKFHADTETIRQRFTPDTIAAEYETMFSQLLQQKGRQ
jgi:glycosyltransferase involved in cell wall biosynthesis